MTALASSYKKKLDAIKAQIQDSDLLKQYLEEEDESFYNQLKDQFEPLIEELHLEVAVNHPLQLIQFEDQLCDEGFEGLFLPRILGYSVLRGALNDSYKYIRPQEQFKKVLLTICNSLNFESLSQRIGQTVEVGFALSSDIWITNLLAEIMNKRVRQFLDEHKLLKYRDIRSRHTAYVAYKKQFRNFNFLTASKPTSASEVKIEFKSIVNFLVFRGSLSIDASSVYDFISGIVADENLSKSFEHLEILMLIGLLFDLKKAEIDGLNERLALYIAKDDTQPFLNTLRKIQTAPYGIKEEDYSRIFKVLENSELKEFKSFLQVCDSVNQIGYINSDAIETVRSYYNKNQGLSIQNECLRNFIFQKFEKYMTSLDEGDFGDYFELNKTFTVYMTIFSNEKFNQGVKGISMKYIKKLLKKYTVKRSKDFQDIKRFVSTTFLDLGFLNEKEIKDLFKTRRKRAVAKA